MAMKAGQGAGVHTCRYASSSASTFSSSRTRLASLAVSEKALANWSACRHKESAHQTSATFGFTPATAKRIGSCHSVAGTGCIDARRSCGMRTLCLTSWKIKIEDQDFAWKQAAARQRKVCEVDLPSCAA